MALKNLSLTTDIGIKLQSDAFFIYDNISLTAVVLRDMIKICPVFHRVVFLLMLGRRVQSSLCSYRVSNVSLFVMELWHLLSLYEFEGQLVEPQKLNNCLYCSFAALCISWCWYLTNLCLCLKLVT